MKTVMITGSSTGIGRATAFAFHEAGWRVFATMRSPEKEQELQNLPNVQLVRLDVTSPESIREAISTITSQGERIDVLVNNAGYGLVGPFEETDDQQIRRQFETNVFGLMAVTRAVIPIMRSQKEGTIVNVASMGGRLTFPFYSSYHGSKWAVDGFSESLHYELEPFGIRVRIVEPGAIRTDFYGRSADEAKTDVRSPYHTMVERAFQAFKKAESSGAPSQAVAKTILDAAQTNSKRLRWVVGKDAKALLAIRRWLGERLFYSLAKATVLGNAR